MISATISVLVLIDLKQCVKFQIITPASLDASWGFGSIHMMNFIFAQL